MASHLKDNIRHGRDHSDPHASDNRWRHQESASYSRHAAAQAQGPRDADQRHGVGDLADFLKGSRVDPKHAPSSSGSGRKYTPLAVGGGAATATAQGTPPGTQPGETVQVSGATTEVVVGPLLNYRRMENATWFGSVLVVTRGGGLGDTWIPELKLSIGGSAQASGSIAGQIDPVNGAEYAHAGQSAGGNGEANITGTKLYSDPKHTFWRFSLQVPLQRTEQRVGYSIPGLTFTRGTKTDRQSFFVPAISESMRIMFHSCNGFSVGTDEAAWSGPALWKDVGRVHARTPFHVMIGGGDQIYNDGIRVHGPLRAWTDISNPKKRKEYPFREELRKACDDYYVDNYIRWYGTEPFSSANGQIPQLNIWDDHDIIDGFGSYVDDFMRCDVFRGIGGVAHKYYLLFQHHLAPPVSSYTSDLPQGASSTGGIVDPRQLENTFVLEEQTIDSSYIIGPKPGPYVVESSRSIYARLGARIAFFGIDARTERTRHQVNYPETYQVIFQRLRQELGAARAMNAPIRHLIVLLGIPIAYPRLTWLENIFASPLMGPLKFLNKRFGFGGSFFNSFDGGVDLLDDLDDHYTARTHKKERAFLVHQLQSLASEFSVRITILGGDVHLAAVGRFYSNPKLEIPVLNDHRYTANIISSAIVNKPPPQAVANLLARRNKIHHLDHDTDETLMKFFDKNPGKEAKTAKFNHVTMPSRNWAMITENSGLTRPAGAGAPSYPANGHAYNGDADAQSETAPVVKDGHSWLHSGEVNAGTQHKAADSDRHGTSSDGSLDVCIRVEKDQHDPEGNTQSYGITVPVLEYNGAAQKTLRPRTADGSKSSRRPQTANAAVGQAS